MYTAEFNDNPVPVNLDPRQIFEVLAKPAETALQPKTGSEKEKFDKECALQCLKTTFLLYQYGDKYGIGTLKARAYKRLDETLIDSVVSAETLPDLLTFFFDRSPSEDIEIRSWIVAFCFRRREDILKDSKSYEIIAANELTAWRASLRNIDHWEQAYRNRPADLSSKIRTIITALPYAITRIYGPNGRLPFKCVSCNHVTTNLDTICMSATGKQCIWRCDKCLFIVALESCLS